MDLGVRLRSTVRPNFSSPDTELLLETISNISSVVIMSVVAELDQAERSHFWIPKSKKHRTVGEVKGTKLINEPNLYHRKIRSQ